MVGYRPRTRELIEAYLRRKGSATQTEIGALGGEKQLITWRSLRAILADLEREQRIVVDSLGVGGRIRIITWVVRDGD